MRTAHYGELATECATAYYRYGSALLYQVGWWVSLPEGLPSMMVWAATLIYICKTSGRPHLEYE